MTPPGPSKTQVQAAAQALHRGELVAFATETVYGLGADADNDQAVAQIFKLKGRPSNHPLIVHIAHWDCVEHYAQHIPAFAKTLMQSFWPGALTLILQKRPGVAHGATAQEASIGLRWPSHPVALALLNEARLLGVQGVAAPSANRFGRVSPTRAAHVRDEFGPNLMVLGTQDCDIGIESTIIDCTRGVPILLRPGLIDQTALEKTLQGRVLRQDELDQELNIDAALDAADNPGSNARHENAPKASGTLASHYAPTARVRLLTAAQIALELDAITVHRRPPGLAVGALTKPHTHPITMAIWARAAAVQTHPCPSGVMIRPMPTNPRDCAHTLFATLRDFDALGVDEIWIETPPQGPTWAGVLDRLSRASHTDTKN